VPVVPTAFTTALAQAAIRPDLWLEVEGLPWAFGHVTRDATFFSARTATESKRLGVLALMEGVPAGVEQEARPIDGDGSVGRLTLRLVDDSAGHVLDLVAGAARTDYVLTLSADMAAGTADIASLVVTGTPDATAYPVGGGTFYIGRETFTYASRSGSTFSTVKRARYRIEGQGDTWSHTAGDWITPYARFVKTRRAALYMTLDGADANKVTRLLGTVAGLKSERGLTSFSLEMDSGLSLFRPRVHLGQIRGKLAVGVKAGDGSYGGSVDAAVDEGDPSTAAGIQLALTPSAVTGRAWTVGQRVVVRIGDEYFAGELAASDTISVVAADGGGRGCFNSPTTEHSPGDEVVEVLVLGERATTSLPEMQAPYTTSGNPLHLWLAVLLSKLGDGSNGTWDVMPFGGVGVDAAFVDVAGVEAMAAQWLPAMRHLEVVEEPVEFSTWSASLLRTVACYPVQRLDGKLTVKRMTAPVSGTYRTLSVTNIASVPDWDANLGRVVGRLVVRADYDPNNSSSERGPYRTTYKGEMVGPGNEAQEHYANAFAEEVVECPGQWSGLASSPSTFGGGQVTSADEVFARLFDIYRARFARPWPKLAVEALYDTLDIEEGDLVAVSLDHLPNVVTGARGLTSQVCEVLRKAPDEARGVVQFTVHQTGDRSLARRYAPAGVVASVAGSTITIQATAFSAAGGHDAAGFVVGEVVEVWTSDLKSSRGTWTVQSLGTDSLVMTAGVTGAGITAGDLVTPAAFTSQSVAVQRAHAFIANAAGAFSDSSAAHVFQS